MSGDGLNVPNFTPILKGTPRQLVRTMGIT